MPHLHVDTLKADPQNSADTSHCGLAKPRLGRNSNSNVPRAQAMPRERCARFPNRGGRYAADWPRVGRAIDADYTDPLDTQDGIVPRVARTIHIKLVRPEAARISRLPRGLCRPQPGATKSRRTHLTGWFPDGSPKSGLELGKHQQRRQVFEIPVPQEGFEPPTPS
jgi:hypothetical protein